MSDATGAVEALQATARIYDQQAAAALVALRSARAAGNTIASKILAAELDAARGKADLARARAWLVTKVPYPKFCRHPEKCVGLSHCERDPVCCD